MSIPVARAAMGERIEQHVSRIFHAVALSQFRCEKRADPGLEQSPTASFFEEQATAGELDPPKVIGLGPALPQRSRGVSEHRSTIEPLPVSFEGPDASHTPYAMPSNVPGIDESLPLCPVASRW